MKEFFTYTTPEKVGISSDDVLTFLKELEHYGVYLHSYFLAKEHQIFAEGYRKPFKQNQLHRIYSVTKTFVSMAIGILIDDAKVSLEDKILKFFPEYAEKCTDKYIRNMTIEDMLKMSTPYSFSTTYSAKRPAYLEPCWVDTFFNVETSHPSGTVYNYDTSASYMLGVVVERLTNMPFLEFLKERALSRIGFSEGSKCLKAPEGYSWGGSAILCSTLDLAKFARLVMDYGKWDGEQLLPEEYIKEAISKKVDNNQSGFIGATGGHGYGYQIRRTIDNTFSFTGMGHQFAICMPEEDLLFVCTADTQGMDGASNIIFINLWKHIKQIIKESPLPENNNAHNTLLDYGNNLEYKIFEGKSQTETGERINGKKFVLSPNPMEIAEISFLIDDDGNGTINYINKQGCKKIKFGVGKTIIDEFPQDGYFGDTIGKDGNKHYKCIASGAWTLENTLHIKVDIIDDYIGNLNIIATFKGKEIGIYMEPHAEWFLQEYKGFAGGIMSES